MRYRQHARIPTNFYVNTPRRVSGPSSSRSLPQFLIWSIWGREKNEENALFPRYDQILATRFNGGLNSIYRVHKLPRCGNFRLTDWYRIVSRSSVNIIGESVYIKSSSALRKINEIPYAEQNVICNSSRAVSSVFSGNVRYLLCN